MVRRTLVLGLVALASATVAFVAPWQSDPTTASANSPGWIGSETAAYDQQTGARLLLPSSFASANLLVAIVGNDGPDSNSTETHATFGGPSGLRWTRLAHVSARQDWAAPGDSLDLAGASSAEVWMARPPAGWS